MQSEVQLGVTLLRLLNGSIALTGISLLMVTVLSALRPYELELAAVLQSDDLPNSTIASNAANYATTAYYSATNVTHVEVHLSQRQVVLYQGDRPIKSYPIGVGRPGWETPTGAFRVTQMKRNPVWINPFTNESIPATDPRNPLHGYWIGFWTDGNNWIGFHGTLDDRTVGRAESHGCIHMYKSDLAELYSLLDLGMPVMVLN